LPLSGADRAARPDARSLSSTSAVSVDAVLDIPAPTRVVGVDCAAKADTLPVVDVVVLAYGEEPWLDACLKAVLSSTGVEVRLQLVDNGCSDAAAAALLDDRIRLYTPGRNTGYAGGCVLAASASEAPYLAFVNSDAVVEAGALEALVTALDDPSVGLVTGCVLLGGPDGVIRDDEGQELVNAAGNPVHWLGFSWAGGYRDPVSLHLRERDVAGMSGALFAVRRGVWAELDGFDPEFFAYHEDVDLSLRVWCTGRRVRYVPQARCTHWYEFFRNPGKLTLIERNRLMTVLTVYQLSTLVRVLPMLLLTEVGVLIVAVLNGWAGAKLRGWFWLVGHGGYLMRRRRELNALRRVPDNTWMHRLDNSLSLPAETPGAVPPFARGALRTYWRIVAPRSPKDTSGCSRTAGLL
jgi:GT2 family glycosyltransferase